MADEQQQTFDPRDLNKSGSVSTAEVFASLVQSKTVWGVIVLILSAVAPQVGALLDENVEAILSVLSQAGVLVGGILGIWGRMTAKGPIVTKA